MSGQQRKANQGGMLQMRKFILKPLNQLEEKSQPEYSAH